MIYHILNYINMKKEHPKFDKVKAFLKEKAPSVLDLIGDVLPNQGTLGIIKNIISKEDIPDPDKLEFERLVRDFEQQELQAYLTDKQDARDLQKSALLQNSWLAKHYLYILASLVILAAIGFGIALIYINIPEKNQRLVEMFADIFLFSGAIMVLNFFFGSSKGSMDKNSMLNK